MPFDWKSLQADLEQVKSVYDAVVQLVEKVAADLKKEIVSNPSAGQNMAQELHNEAHLLADAVVKNTSAEKDKHSDKSSGGKGSSGGDSTPGGAVGGGGGAASHQNEGMPKHPDSSKKDPHSMPTGGASGTTPKSKG
jgi:hypothetical protein